jgi:TPR repeat protein
VKWKAFSWAFLVLLWLSAGILYGQQHAPERSEFEKTRAKAEKGDAEAQLSLGLFYASGSGVAPDLGKAAKWERKAAEQGLARAELELGRDYVDGSGVKPDAAEAFKWFHSAADQGLPEAQFATGRCYARGNGVNQDVREAVKWYRLAAKQNFAQALEEIGQCYIDGTGVATDLEEGVKWVRKAADLGYAPAQNRLGLCYVKGQGVPKDLVQAYKWFDLGASQGGELAPDIKLNLAKVESKLTPAQIAEAQRLAREFEPVAPGDATKDAADKSANPQNRDSIATSKNTGGLVSVDAQDISYEVYVDGSFVGNPIAKIHLQEGSHVVEVKKPGFKDYRKSILVSNGSELNLHVALEKQ